MKIATWNVNSIAVRLPLVLDWLAGNRPDVICLQETKCIDEKFPASAFHEIGYHVETFGQRTYNGVATLSLLPAENAHRGFADDPSDAQKRLIAVTVNGVRIINVYVPNGAFVGSEKYEFKLDWLGRLRKYFNQSYDPKQMLVICGDFNIAPEDLDVYNPKLWAGKILCSEPERAALKRVGDWGLIDTFRQHHQDAGHFSWWDYRAGAFPQNHGLRIDHLWATESLAQKCIEAWIDKVPRALEKPSDHAPVMAEFAI